MSMNIVWILTGVVMVVGFVALISYFVNSGKKTGAKPTTTQYDTQDAPPPDSDRSV
jgi:hypothetical protein